MQIVKENQKHTVQMGSTVKVHEYPIEDGFIGGAVAEINGRYPETGYVMNKKIKEVAYVMSGSGRIIKKDGGEHHLSVGDFIFIDHREIYAWEGNSLVLFLSTTPAFDPVQHVELT